jgi:DNA-binding transcriptional ArsR family regulator
VKVKDLVYAAIADPTRRAILDRLMQSECSVKEVASSFAISQPAISQHLRELRMAGLVSYRKVHRENRYRLRAAPLRPVFKWLDRFRTLTDPAGHFWVIDKSSRAENQQPSKGKEG